jgi:hypothetical protein
VLLACTYTAFQMAGTTTVISSQSGVKQIIEHNFFVFNTTHVISSQETAREVPTDVQRWEKTVKVTKYSPVAILFFVVLLGWLYVIAVNLNKKIPDTVKMNLTKFKYFFFIPITLGFLSNIFSHFLFKIVNSGESLNWAVFFSVMIVLSLFQMICFFYCIYFSAKSLKSVELQRPVTFTDFVLDFFLFLFFPVGVWLIQPRINKIFNETT